jgi:16S rRNA G966 N2-methylase RsmD
MFYSLVQRRQLQEFYLRNFNKVVENEDFCNSNKKWLQLRLLLIAENKKPVNMPISHNSLLTHKKKKMGTSEPLILRQVHKYFLQSTESST